MALAGIVVQQFGHSLVGAEADLAASGTSRLRALMPLTSRKMQNATIMKLIVTVRKFP